MSAAGRSTRVDQRRRRIGNTAAAVALVGSIVAVTCGLMHVATEPLEPCTTTSTSVCSGPPVDHTEDGTRKDSLPPCLTEDSPDCFWDASEMGNGQGHDVTNPPEELP